MSQIKYEWKWLPPEYRHLELAMLSLDIWDKGTQPVNSKIGLASFINPGGGTGV
jgi:hypothetical protein